jgi:glycosyltransferase involved in cell wall biosynthesis
MNILMVLSGNTLPHDRRVEREARDLIQAGHKVYILARKGLGQSSEEIFNEIHIIRMEWPFLNRNKLLSDFIYQVIQRHMIYSTIVKECQEHAIEAIHVHDLPYAYASFRAARKLRLPLIYDTHENYPVLYETIFKSRRGKWAWPLFYWILSKMRKEEKKVCQKAHCVIVVAEEHKDRISRLGAPDEKIIEVTNTEDIDFFGGLDTDQDIIDRYKDDFVLLFIGVFSAHRGLETAIEAMPKIIQHVPNAKLLLVGGGSFQFQYEKLIRKLNISDYVCFPGYQPFGKLPTYIALSDVGIIPHISTPHIETTMPNKIFQFMTLGKPVLVSNVKPLIRVVQDAQCGSVFTAQDVESFTEKVIYLAENPEQLEIYGKNGKRAVEKKYNWQQTVKPLLKIYRELEQVRR